MRRHTPAALVVALLAGAVVVVGNQVAQSRELDLLLHHVLDAQNAVAYSDHRVAAMVDYTRPLLFGANVPQHARDGLQQLVQDAAAGQVRGLVDERKRSAASSVLVWHRALRRARAALVAYVDARVAFLRSVAVSSRTLYVEHPELDRLLRQAQRTFEDAAGQGQRHRVEVAFAGGTHPG